MVWLWTWHKFAMTQLDDSFEDIIAWDDMIEQERDAMKSHVSQVLSILQNTGVKEWWLTRQRYSNTVLPLLSAITLQGEDSLCQELILAKVIEGFKVDYLLSSLELLLDTVSSANQDVGVMKLVLSLMEKLSTHYWTEETRDHSMFPQF